jgi:hypothetical protein
MHVIPPLLLYGSSFTTLTHVVGEVFFIPSSYELALCSLWVGLIWNGVGNKRDTQIWRTWKTRVGDSVFSSLGRIHVTCLRYVRSNNERTYKCRIASFRNIPPAISIGYWKTDIFTSKTNSMQQNSSKGAYNFSAVQETLLTSWEKRLNFQTARQMSIHFFHGARAP